MYILYFISPALLQAEKDPARGPQPRHGMSRKRVLILKKKKNDETLDGVTIMR